MGPRVLVEALLPEIALLKRVRLARPTASVPGKQPSGNQWGQGTDVPRLAALTHLTQFTRPVA